MPNALIALVGPTGAGKSTLMQRVANQERLGLRILKSVTTRSRRDLGDDPFYEFVQPGEFERRKNANAFFQCVRYATASYGTDRAHLEDVLRSYTGITALTEEGVTNFRIGGCRVFAVKVVPLHTPAKGADPARAAADAEREKRQVVYDLVIENSFLAGGLDASTRLLADFCAEHSPKRP